MSLIKALGINVSLKSGQNIYGLILETTVMGPKNLFLICYFHKSFFYNMRLFNQSN